MGEKKKSSSAPFSPLLGNFYMALLKKSARLLQWVVF